MPDQPKSIAIVGGGVSSLAAASAWNLQTQSTPNLTEGLASAAEPPSYKNNSQLAKRYLSNLEPIKEQSTRVLVQDNKFTKVSVLAQDRIRIRNRKEVCHMGCFEWCLLYQNQVPE